MKERKLSRANTKAGIQERKDAVIDCWNRNNGYLSVKDIAAHLSLGESTVRSYLQQEGIIKPQKRVNASQAQKRRIQFAKQLSEEGLTAESIGKILKCKRETIRDYLSGKIN